MRNVEGWPSWRGLGLSPASAARLLISIVLALLLWAWVTTQQDPTIPRLLRNIPLQEAELPEPLLLVGTLDMVTVEIEGPRSVVQGLTEADLTPRLDLSQVDGPGDYTVPVNVTMPDAVRTVRVTPRQMPILVDETAARSFHVEPTYPPIDETIRRIGAVVPSVSEVTVSGPKRFVDDIDRVVLPVEIGDQTSDFLQSTVPVAENEAGEAITEVQIQPGAVEVSVDIEARGREVPVLIQTVGDPAQGYEVSDRVANPAFVVLDGPPDVVDEIVSVSTAPVRIEGATAPVNQSVGLVDLPPGVSVVDPPNGLVVVVIQVRPRGVAQTLPDQAVVVVNAPPGTEVTVEPGVVMVDIYASEDALAGLRAGDIVPRVNANGLAPGTYDDLPISVSVPAGVQWTQTEPARVRVVVTVASSTPVASPGPEP